MNRRRPQWYLRARQWLRRGGLSLIVDAAAILALAALGYLLFVVFLGWTA